MNSKTNRSHRLTHNYQEHFLKAETLSVGFWIFMSLRNVLFPTNLLFHNFPYIVITNTGVTNTLARR